MSYEPQQYPPGVHAVGFVNPFPPWLQPLLLLGAGFVLLKFVAPSAFGAARRK